MAYTFPFSVVSGKGDAADSQIDVPLSDEDCARLAASAKTYGGGPLDEDPLIRDIFDEVLLAILDDERKVLEDNPELLEDLFDDEEDEEEREDNDIEGRIEAYLEELDIRIGYPKALL